MLDLNTLKQGWEIKKVATRCSYLVYGEPAGIQTPTLLIRSQMLYSVKLQVQKVKNVVFFAFRTANVKNKFSRQNTSVLPWQQKG